MLNVVRLETLHYRAAVTSPPTAKREVMETAEGLPSQRLCLAFACRVFRRYAGGTRINRRFNGRGPACDCSNMPISEVELVADARAVIGESPLWCGDQRALYWIDVKAPALYRTTIAALETTSWQLPSDIGGYALKTDTTGALLGLRTGIFALDFATGELVKLCEAPFDP